eukprot:GHVH01013963.1.p1 GENE.GHVH01013963.1~~GHVH01013963.1.p1  ORF type:complete len:719 (+),score=58.57 GHVH01013963.1:61-2217(+)
MSITSPVVSSPDQFDSNLDVTTPSTSCGDSGTPISEPLLAPNEPKGRRNGSKPNNGGGWKQADGKSGGWQQAGGRSKPPHTEVNGIEFDTIPRYMSDNQLHVFRTLVCQIKKSANHSGVDCSKDGDCPYSHCLSWQKRNPALFDYIPQMCPHLNLSREDALDGRAKGALKVKNSCFSGQRCRYSHTKEEQLYHPQVYKTKLCNAWNLEPNLNRCRKYYCPFAHGDKEIRRPVSARENRGGQQQSNYRINPNGYSNVRRHDNPLKPIRYGERNTAIHTNNNQADITSQPHEYQTYEKIRSNRQLPSFTDSNMLLGRSCSQPIAPQMPGDLMSRGSQSQAQPPFDPCNSISDFASMQGISPADLFRAGQNTDMEMNIGYDLGDPSNNESGFPIPGIDCSSHFIYPSVMFDDQSLQSNDCNNIAPMVDDNPSHTIRSQPGSVANHVFGGGAQPKAEQSIWFNYNNLSFPGQVKADSNGHRKMFYEIHFDFKVQLPVTADVSRFIGTSPSYSMSSAFVEPSNLFTAPLFQSPRVHNSFSRYGIDHRSVDYMSNQMGSLYRNSVVNVNNSVDGQFLPSMPVCQTDALSQGGAPRMGEVKNMYSHPPVDEFSLMSMEFNASSAIRSQPSIPNDGHGRRRRSAVASRILMGDEALNPHVAVMPHTFDAGLLRGTTSKMFPTVTSSISVQNLSDKNCHQSLSEPSIDEQERPVDAYGVDNQGNTAL